MIDMPPGCPWHGNKWVEEYAAHPMHSPLYATTVWRCKHPVAQLINGRMTNECRVIIVLAIG